MGYNTKFLPETALSADFTSPAAQVLDNPLFSIQAAFTGSTCSFTAEVFTSSDEYNNTIGFVPEHLDPYPNSSVTFTESGSFTWNVNGSGFTWVLLKITDNSSGSNDGAISARIQTKNNG